MNCGGAGPALQGLAEAACACVENSLDAGASDIDVVLDFERFGFSVDDNGCGLALDALEALAGAARPGLLPAAHRSLSRIIGNAVVHIRSRARGSFETHALLCTTGGGATCSLAAEQQARQGTNLRVCDLLYRQPVRQKALARTPGG
jgi:DNA mismatch repair ATPase MutL